MRISMISPIVRRRRCADRRWQPQSRLGHLLGTGLAADCSAAVLPEVNGIGAATPRSGGTLSLVRSSPTRWLSSGDGRVRLLPPDGWRAEAGIYGSGTNLCLQSEALDTAPWSPQQGATAVLDAATPGPLDRVYKITDPGTQPNSAVLQTLGGLSDGQPHALSIFVKPGTTTGFAIGLLDQTVSAWRALTYFSVSGGLIRIASVFAGTCRLEPVPQSTWCRITVRAATVVAANLNRCFLYVTTVGVTQSGYLWMTGVQVQTGNLAQPYIPTTTAAASRSADSLTLSPSALGPAFTVGAVTRVGDHAAGPYLAYLPGTAGDSNRLDLSLDPAAGLTVAVYDGTGTVKTWTQNVAPADGETARWVIANDNAGGVRAWKNGVELTLTPAGAGSAVRSAVGDTLQLGRRDMTHFLQGELRAWLQFNRALCDAEVGRLDAALQRLGT